jgi:AcrR family transcriptional regulator
MLHSTSPITKSQGLRERRKSVTRSELLLAGRKLFSEKGLYLSRVADLTSGAGIAKGTLYQYFRSKEHLVQAVVEAGFSELREFVEQRVRAASDGDALLLNLVEAHIEFLEANPDLMRIFHQVRGVLKFEGAGWRPLRRVLTQHLDGLADRMSAVRWIPDDHARRREHAELLFGAVSGTMSVRASTGSRHELSQAPEALARALVSMSKEYERLRPGAGRGKPAAHDKSVRRILKR